MDVCCPSCSELSPEGSPFCVACGQSFSGQIFEQPQEIPVTQNAVEEVPASRPGNRSQQETPTAGHQLSRPATSRQGMPAWAVMLIVVVCIGVGYLVFSPSSNHSTTPGEPSSSILPAAPTGQTTPTNAVSGPVAEAPQSVPQTTESIVSPDDREKDAPVSSTESAPSSPALDQGNTPNARDYSCGNCFTISLPQDWTPHETLAPGKLTVRITKGSDEDIVFKVETDSQVYPGPSESGDLTYLETALDKAQAAKSRDEHLAYSGHGITNDKFCSRDAVLWNYTEKSPTSGILRRMTKYALYLDSGQVPIFVTFIRPEDDFAAYDSDFNDIKNSLRWLR